MPIYEFCCEDCGRLTSVFTRSVSSTVAPVCRSCGGMRLVRAPATFAYHRSEQRILEAHGTPGPSAGAVAYKDPRQIGRWVEQRFDQMGIDLPAEARTMIDAARAGEFPHPIMDL